MQFSDDDLEAAVAAQAITAEAAAGLRVFVERRRATPAADEESFRLLTGFNDIFVAIAAAMVLAAIGWLAAQRNIALAGGLVAAASWGLAEFFTRVRRQALPSILLLAGFVGGVLVAAIDLQPIGSGPGVETRILIIGAAGVLAAFLHWKRFQVPITVAAGVLTLGGACVALVTELVKADFVIEVAILVAGLATFAFALAWDMSDRLRKTRRADVAFWLHLLAAPAIVHPAFSLLGVRQAGAIAITTSDWPPTVLDQHVLLHAIFAVAIYALLAVVALVIDRRALMVSGLLYLIYAMDTALRATGALTLSLAASALVVGAGLLLLSAFWSTARRAALRLVPSEWRSGLPPAA